MANTTITPLAAPLSLSIQRVALALVGALTLGGSSASMDLGVSALSGSASFFGSAPALALGTTTPFSGAASFAGNGPLLSLNIASGGAATLSAAGIAPIFGSGSAPDLFAGTASLTGLAPQLAAGIVTPNPGSTLFSGNPATIAVPNVSLQAPAGALQMIGGASSPGASIVPVTGQWGSAGLASRLNFTVALTAAGTGPLSMSSTGPSLAIGLAPQSGTAMLTTFGILSPTLSPSIASLNMTGGAPGLTYGSPQIAPSSGLAQLIGIGVSFTLSVPAAPTANLVLGGTAPQVLAQSFALPLAGALQANGAAASLVQATLPRILAGAAQLSSVAPALAGTINGTAGAGILSASSPIVSSGTVLSASVGAALIAGSQPVFVPGVAFAAGSAAIGITGYAPAILPASVTPAGVTAWGSVGPTIGLTINPATTGIALTGAAATINGQAIIAVPGAALGLATGLPVQSYARNPSVGAMGVSGVGLQIDSGLNAKAGSLGIASAAPAVSLSGLVLSLTGAATVAGMTPILASGVGARAGVLQFAGIPPVVNSLTTVFTVSGALSFGGDGSTITQPGVILPPAGALVIASDQIQMLRSGYAAPPTMDLALAVTAPRVIQTVAGYCIPATGGLVFVGQPAVNALYETDATHIVTLTGPYQYIVRLEG